MIQTKREEALQRVIDLITAEQERSLTHFSNTALGIAKAVCLKLLRDTQPE